MKKIIFLLVIMISLFCVLIVGAEPDEKTAKDMAQFDLIMAEIKSLKRILDDRGENGFVLCAIDEVLRGTNTIERVAASAQVLEALEERGTLCLIATHDVELCDMAGDGYQKAHFEERISDTDIVFDYQIKPGPATTRNAIHLLKLMGFDEEIVQAAHARADRYVETGKWTN